MAVIVLGNRLKSDEIHSHLRGRVDLGIRLFRECDDELLVMTGGQSNQDSDATEAEVMRDYAIEQGISREHIVCEPEARDTIGNAYFTRLIIEEHQNISTIRVATSCYHASRAIYVFECCYGDQYEITAPDCYNSAISASEKNDASSMSLNRQFFQPIEPGDLAAIQDRMIEQHGLYSTEDFTSVSVE